MSRRRRRTKRPRRLRLPKTKKPSPYVVIGIIVLVAFFVVVWPKKAKPPHIAVKPKPPPVAVKKDKIAIVIDDWGYSGKNIHFVNDIDAAFTLAVLPNLPYSREAAESAHDAGKEVIVHLPLEPHDDRQMNMEKKVVLVGMPKGQIIDIMEDAFESVPFSRGVNNHMGSKATESIRVMKIIFQQLKKKRMYFLDSFVTPESVCPLLAREVKIKFAQRDVFLDNRLDADYIRGQLNQLVAEAKKNGSAVGIGHDRSTTLQAIADAVDDIKQQDIEFVFVSEVVR